MVIRVVIHKGNNSGDNKGNKLMVILMGNNSGNKKG